jgi:hypothetical protein
MNEEIQYQAEKLEHYARMIRNTDRTGAKYSRKVSFEFAEKTINLLREELSTDEERVDYAKEASSTEANPSDSPETTTG